MNNNFSTFASKPTTLNMETLQKIIDLVYPVLYYTTEENLERGKFCLVKETYTNPEFVVCHPDDFENLKKTINWRRFVHIKDESREEVLERLKKILKTKMNDDWRVLPNYGYGLFLDKPIYTITGS